MQRTKPDPVESLRRYLRLHVIVYLAVAAILATIDLFLSDTRWFHWPVMVWGAVLCVHLLYCKSISVDENWADERADKLREKSYDLGHMMEIEESYKNAVEASTSEDRPPAEHSGTIQKR